MESLPVELMILILSLAMDVHPIPSHILCTNSTWNKTLGPILHENIRLFSLAQLYYFGTTARLCRKPKRFSLYLSGGPVHFTRGDQSAEPPIPLADEAERDPQKTHWIRMKVLDGGGVWGCLKTALCLCPKVETVTLQLHSFISDPDLKLLTSALSIINPRVFQWTGPDPEHHISVAIVPRATEYLFKSIKSWSRLEKLMLTNIHFPSPPASSVFNATFTFQTHSLLQEIHIGQAIFLPPNSIAAMVMMIPSLRSLTLEDVYVSSIWGPRVRDSDVFGELRYLKEEDPRKQRLKEIVQCTVRLERIVGGDRGD